MPHDPRRPPAPTSRPVQPGRPAPSHKPFAPAARLLLVGLAAIALAACGRPDAGAADGATAEAAPAEATPPDPCAWPTPTSTATESVSLLACDFDIPQLERTRRVWVYLPPGYRVPGDTTRYPVLYMHDGQNVFDAATSYVGEWGVDETLDSLAATGARVGIVVAVDHGVERRLDEYSPWRNDAHDAGGEGDAYVDFLATTLKPFIDERYRTMPEREATGVAGSSMGGLISLYAALRYPEVFGRVGVFSPAFWFTPGLYDFAARHLPFPPDTRVYMVTGAREGDDPETYAHGHERMAALLRDSGSGGGAGAGRDADADADADAGMTPPAGAGRDAGAGGGPEPAQVEAVIRADGTHNEGFWRREFPAAYRWLFER